MKKFFINILGFFGLLLSLLLMSCEDQAWNNPYPVAENGQNILYSSFSDRPNHLDPAQSYSSNEITFTGQIYEPPLQYHYLKRPYELIPLTATRIPKPVYLDDEGERLPDTALPDEIAFTLYDIEIQKGIHFQPHPSFAMDTSGEYAYHFMNEEQLANIFQLGDFEKTDTRELTAADYVYQIKRLAHPKLHSPIFGFMTDYITGLKEYAGELKNASEEMEAHAVSTAVNSPRNDSAACIEPL